MSVRYESLEEVEVEAEHARSMENMRDAELLAHLKLEITKQVIAESRQARAPPSNLVLSRINANIWNFFSTNCVLGLLSGEGPNKHPSHDRQPRTARFGWQHDASLAIPGCTVAPSASTQPWAASRPHLPKVF